MGHASGWSEKLHESNVINLVASHYISVLWQQVYSSNDIYIYNLYHIQVYHHAAIQVFFIVCLMRSNYWPMHLIQYVSVPLWGGWGCEVSCGGHHRPRGKTTTGSALDGTVFDIAQILAYLVHNMSRSQLYLRFGHFVWLPSFFGQ